MAEATNHTAHPEGDEDLKRAVLENLDALDRMPPMLGLVDYLGFVFFLPAVIAMARQNAEVPHIIAANSRFSRLSWMAIGAGVVVWGLYILAEVA